MTAILNQIADLAIEDEYVPSPEEEAAFLAAQDEIESAFLDASEKPQREEREYFIARTTEKIASMLAGAMVTGSTVEIAPHAVEGRTAPSYVTLRPITLSGKYVQYSNASGMDKALALTLIGTARTKNPRYRSLKAPK